jgi:hypothetical protein
VKKTVKPIPRFFVGREEIKDPFIIYPRPEPDREGTVYERRQLDGTYYLVEPSCPMEISFLRMLEHRIEKFAPATGEGIIVSAEALAKIDA